MENTQQFQFTLRTNESQYFPLDNKYMNIQTRLRCIFDVPAAPSSGDTRTFRQIKNPTSYQISYATAEMVVGLGFAAVAANRALAISSYFERDFPTGVERIILTNTLDQPITGFINIGIVPIPENFVRPDNPTNIWDPAYVAKATVQVDQKVVNGGLTSTIKQVGG
jgi:hypothetical protein